jgi:hypothetical protein
MKSMLKRKQKNEQSDDYFIPYKKRLVCEFTNMSLEEPTSYYEKKIFQKDPLNKERKIISEDDQNYKEMKQILIKPHTLTWNDVVKEKIGKIIQPEFILDKMINFYEKE